MPRITSIFNGSAVRGESETNIRLNANQAVIQVVLDRTRFENLTVKSDPICKIMLYSGRHYMGGAAWSGGRIEGDRDSPRPLQRMLWSIGRWPIPRGTRDVRVVLRADRGFSALVHIDTFTAAELRR